MRSAQRVSAASDLRPLSPRARVRVALIETAERLFAEHGVDSVSLRQIASAAGYSNTTAVQYHFGTKGGLCAAIIEHRLPDIDARTEELLGQAPPNDLETLVEAMVRPLLEHNPDSHYIAFLSRFISTIGQHEAAFEVAMRQPAWKRLRTAIDDLQPDVPPEVRRLRMGFAASLMMHALAERRSWVSTRRRGLSGKDFERELMASICDILRVGTRR